MQKKTEELIALGPEVGSQAATTAHWISQWMYNTRLNVPAIDEDFERRDANLACLSKADFHPRVKDIRQIMVLGSGPSLHLADKFIKDWKGILVAGPTNAGWAAAHGRVPDLIISVDANDDSVTALGDFPYEEHGCGLISSVEGNPNMVKKWKYNRWWYLAHMSPIDGSLQPEREMYNVLQHLMFPEIRTWGFMVGCTPNQAIQQMFHWGRQHGLENIFTLGTDFAYGKELQRHRRYEYIPVTDEWICVGDGKQQELPGEPFKEVNGYKTTEQMLRYLDNFYKVILIDGISVWNCSEGIADLIPHADIEEVIASTGQSIAPITREEMKECLKPYVDEQLRLQRERVQAASTSGTSTKTVRGSSIFDMLEALPFDGKQNPSSSEQPSTPEKPPSTGEDQLELPVKP